MKTVKQVHNNTENMTESSQQGELWKEPAFFFPFIFLNT